MPLPQLVIHLPQFDGPLDLLLQLVEKRQLPITEVRLADVADQYLEAVLAMPSPSPELLAEFLVIAGKLILIKSQALLPAEEEVAPHEEDPEEDLKRRLIEYRLFKSAGERLRELEDQERRAFPRTAPPPADLPPPPLVPPAPHELAQAMARVLERATGLLQKPAAEVAVARARIEDRIEWVFQVLRRRQQAQWRELAGSTVDEVVATFLAVLELLRRGVIVVEQEAPFSEMRLSLSRAPDGPR